MRDFILGGLFGLLFAVIFIVGFFGEL